MGQYFKQVLLREDNVIIAWACSWAYNNGAKLMEHSWLGNSFVAVAENLLLKNPTRVVWCGDYSDKDPSLGIDEEQVKAGYDGTMNFYDLCEYKGNAIKEVKEGITSIGKRAKYVVNHTTKEFIDKTKVPVTNTYVDNDGKSWDYNIHPLPLMTCNSNGRGGGDFRDEYPNGLVGRWSGNLISIETRKPKGFTEVIFDLIEK